MTKLLLGLLALPLVGAAQVPAAWGGGVGVGNIVEAHLGYQRQGWLGLARTQYRWWGVSQGLGSAWGDEVNTNSRQVEVAVLGGYGVPLGRGLLYSGAGLSYLRGRQLGDLQYMIAKNSFLGGFSYHYSYRDYHALGLPVELGVLSRPLGKKPGDSPLRVGLAFQADFNPERTSYAGVLTLWLGSFGHATRRPG